MIMGGMKKIMTGDGGGIGTDTIQEAEARLTEEKQRGGGGKQAPPEEAGR